MTTSSLLNSLGGSVLGRCLSLFFYIPHSPNPVVYVRVTAVVKHPNSYYVLTTFHVPGLPRFAYSVTNLIISQAKYNSANCGNSGQNTAF